jgi:TonB family protein
MSPYAFVVTWTVQAALLGLVALVLPRVFRVRHPSLLESWWGYGTLAVVLFPVLPVLLPSQRSAPPPLASFVESTTVALTGVSDDVALLSPLAWLAVLWASGVAVRVAWLFASQRRLHRLAAEGTSLDADPALSRARALAAVHPTPLPLRGPVPVIETDQAGPCVFGGWADVQVLVPRQLAALPEDQRVAVYLHELLHAVRRDVQRGYLDEACRLVWWWQPSVWWMLARLRLARELQVDRAVVAATGARRAYVEALLWCGTRRRTLALSSQVGGGRHALVRRVALLCEEVEMSRLRRWSSMVALSVGFASASALLGQHSPLRAAQLIDVPAGMTAQAGPLERVAVRPTLDHPAPRRTLHVSPAWPVGVASAVRFRVHLVIDASGRVAETRIASGVGASAGRAVAAEASAVLEAVRQWEFEPPSQAPMLLATYVGTGDDEGTVLPLAEKRAPLRIDGTIGPPSKILDVKPEYPADAIAAKIQGVVIIESTIDTEGAVSDVRVLRSIPGLDEAAMDAVRQWRYTPTLLNGEAVPVIMTVTVNFTLAK